MQIPVPEELSYKPYQLDGIAFASQRDGALIADEMGLGKTVQAIGVLNADETLQRVLVVCPASLKLNWKRELEKWLVHPRTVGVAQGRKGWPETADIVVMNYEIANWHKQNLKGEWDCVILDEAQYLANKQAKRTKAIVGVSGRGGVKARKKIALSGTPLRNRPRELYTVVKYLDPGAWPTYEEYAKRYCDLKWEWVWIPGRGRTRVRDDSGSSNEVELRQKLYGGAMIRRLKRDVLKDLPAKTRQVIEVDIGARALLNAERRIFDRCGGSIESLADELLQQPDLADEFEDVRTDIMLRKIDKVVDHLDDVLTEVDKVVVFAYHRLVINQLVERLNESGYNPQVIHGGTPTADRQAAVDNFQDNPEARVFVGQIVAAGTGLTLTAASLVVFAELDWTPANMSQAEDRCHRIGQTENVLVQHVVAADSVDADIVQRLIEKQQVIDKCIEGGTNAPVEAAQVIQKSRTNHLKKRNDMTEYIERFFTAVERIAGALEVIAGNCCQQPTITTTVKDAEPEPEPPKKKRAPRKKKADPVQEETPAEPTEAPEPEAPEAPAKPVREVSSEDVRAAAKALLEHYQADGDSPDEARTKALTVIGENCKKFKTTIADIPPAEYATVIAALEAAKNA